MNRQDKLRELALRETDPRYYEEFLPITRGPLPAALAILALGLTLPFFYLGRFWESLVARR